MDRTVTMYHSSLDKSRKRPFPHLVANERPEKKIKALLEDETSGEDSASDVSGGVPLERSVSPINQSGFTINQDFARRFEHNKKREELQKLEVKYGTRPTRSEEAGSNKNGIGAPNDDTESSTDSEEEDDEGILATGALDDQFHATFEAIRAKDPRVYDEKAIFYAEAADEVVDTKDTEKNQKPIYLNDYHRKNLMEDMSGKKGEEGEDNEPMTYAEQQDDLKINLVKEMHAAAESFGLENVASDDEFLVPRPSAPESDKRGANIKSAITELNVEIAEKEPETFLLNFMSARAWVPSAVSNMQPFESDDDEDDQRAEMFEEAYNLRFEDPKGSNEKLLSHARDAAAKYSVRREDTNSRKKARDAERARKDAEKQEREEEKARLRKLRIADAEEKIRKIKEAAGLRSTALQESDWAAFLEEGWDDDRWEQAMKRRFGEEYYADQDFSGKDDDTGINRSKVTKPKWKTDIDIKDLVPSFEAEDEMQEPLFTLTDSELGDGDIGQVQPEEVAKAGRKHVRAEEKREARKERRKIEQLVNEELDANETMSGLGTKHAGHFRYRATSPIAYGLTAHDILMASDSQLNQYAGLKKMAAFRDAEKKRRDKKRLGKKARLRQWRKETFGSEHGPQKTLADLLTGETAVTQESATRGGSKSTIEEGKKVKKRSRKSKSKGEGS